MSSVEDDELAIRQVFMEELGVKVRDDRSRLPRRRWGRRLDLRETAPERREVVWVATHRPTMCGLCRPNSSIRRTGNSPIA
jgi:hypothetical protein